MSIKQRPSKQTRPARVPAPAPRDLNWAQAVSRLGVVSFLCLACAGLPMPWSMMVEEEHQRPSDLPPGIPFYPNSESTSLIVQPFDPIEGAFFVVGQFGSSDPWDEVCEYFRKELASTGWRVVETEIAALKGVSLPPGAEEACMLNASKTLERANGEELETAFVEECGAGTCRLRAYTEAVTLNIGNDMMGGARISITQMPPQSNEDGCATSRLLQNNSDDFCVEFAEQRVQLILSAPSVPDDVKVSFRRQEDEAIRAIAERCTSGNRQPSLSMVVTERPTPGYCGRYCVDWTDYKQSFRWDKNAWRVAWNCMQDLDTIEEVEACEWANIPDGCMCLAPAALVFHPRWDAWVCEKQGEQRPEADEGEEEPSTVNEEVETESEADSEVESHRAMDNRTTVRPSPSPRPSPQPAQRVDDRVFKFKKKKGHRRGR